MGKRLKTNMKRGSWKASGYLQKFGQEIFHTEISDGQKLMGRSKKNIKVPARNL